jgi:hypothetical protein
MIHDFRSVRLDGRTISETTDPLTVWNWGEPRKVTAIVWREGPQERSYTWSDGLRATVLPGRQSIAVLRTGVPSILVLNFDGSEKYEVPAKIIVDGKSKAGEFLWLEADLDDKASQFGAILEDRSDNERYRADIDVVSGMIVSTRYVR